MGKHRWPTAGDEAGPPLQPLGRTPHGRGELEDGPGYPQSAPREDHAPVFGRITAPDPVGWDPEADESAGGGGVRWRVARSAALVFLGVALAVGVALFLVRSVEPSAAAVSVQLDAGTPSAPAPPTTASEARADPGEAPQAPPPAEAGSSSPGTVVVYVTGAVASPGVVTVPDGTRLIDVIERVGGALPEADLDVINLAGIPADGQHVHLLAVGEEPRAGSGAQDVPAPPSDGPAGRSDGTGATGGGSASSAGIIDINTATLAEIESLPRVGPVLGQRILDWRDEHGPFARAEDIDAVPGIGPALLAGILPLIVAE